MSRASHSSSSHGSHQMAVMNVGGNSLASEQIRAEIQRFESVHPCIYQAYDLLACLPVECEAIRIQLRDQIVAIEGWF